MQRCEQKIVDYEISFCKSYQIFKTVSTSIKYVFPLFINVLVNFLSFFENFLLKKHMKPNMLANVTTLFGKKV